MLTHRVSQALNKDVIKMQPLRGGMVGEVHVAILADGSSVVVKVGRSAEAALDTEASMLRYLAEHTALPVPDVLHSEEALLIMTFVSGSSHFSPAAEEHAADLLAALHAVTTGRFGHSGDTLIGGLHQPNTPGNSWIDFFRDQRLLHRGDAAMRAGRLPAALFTRLNTLCARLAEWLIEPDRPGLIHGDVWTTNVLADHDHITGFVDPALYYADPEIELAFITLFGTFGEPFFQRYREKRSIRPGFFEERRHIYNLYPLLVHVQLFGGGYVASVARTLRKFGC